MNPSSQREGKAMSLPIVLNSGNEKWDCHQCGHCCRGSLVPLSAADVQLLKSQQWEKDPEYAQRRIMVRHRGASSQYRLAHRSDGSCVFLMEDGLCRIHARYGLEAKPTICQTFPLQLIPQDKQAILTIRRACPSAAADLGSLAAERLPWIKQSVRDARLKADAIPAPAIKPGVQRDWQVARGVLNGIRTLLNDQRYPMVRRLVHALQLANLMSQAKLRTLSDAQILELTATLVELAPEESKPLFEQRREPKAYAKVMFRLLAIECARLHPYCRFQSKWSARWQLMKIATKTALGTGQLPTLDKFYPRARFAELEQARGAWSVDIYQPLTRFIETTSSSFLYALADRPGWSIVESIQALAALYPVGLWLLRWIAHDRPATVEDMLHIIVALDRSQGYAPLSGFIHRQRLATLSYGNELERLIVWYAQ